MDWFFDDGAMILPDPFLNHFSAETPAADWLAPAPADDWPPVEYNPVDDIDVWGKRPNPHDPRYFWDGEQPPTGDDWSYGGGGGGGGGPPTEEKEEECPWAEWYEDAAKQVGLFAGVLGTLKDSPFTLDPRDDRAVEKALIAIDGLEIMLQSQTLDYTTLHHTLSSAVNIILSEGTDHFAAVMGAMAGGFVAGLVDGPLPVGEVVGGIGRALLVYAAGDRLPTEAIARKLADLLLANMGELPGRPCT